MCPFDLRWPWQSLLRASWDSVHMPQEPPYVDTIVCVKVRVSGISPRKSCPLLFLAMPGGEMTRLPFGYAQNLAFVIERRRSCLCREK